jgi:hypothetical protein
MGFELYQNRRVKDRAIKHESQGISSIDYELRITDYE